MARHESAFNTDDPLLIATGELYRQSIAESWTVDTLLDKLQDTIKRYTAPQQDKPVDKTGGKKIVASTPTIEGFVDRLGSYDPGGSVIITQKSPGKRPKLPSFYTYDKDQIPDPLEVEAAFSDLEYGDQGGWDHPMAIFDPDSFQDDSGRSLEDLS